MSKSGPPIIDIGNMSIRGASYPSMTIKQSFDWVKKIYQALGNSSYNTNETIAKVLNVSTSTIKQHLGTANQYNLLELKMKVGYKPTKLFLDIYKPEGSQKEEAMLQCLKSPTLYNLLLKELNGNIIPNVVGLGISLFKRYKVAENASEKASKIFLANLADLNLLDSENRLLYDIANNQVKENDEATEVPLIIEEVNANQTPKYLGQSTYVNNGRNRETEQIPFEITPDELPMHIRLKNGRKVKIAYPQDITNDEIDKIINMISDLKE